MEPHRGHEQLAKMGSRVPPADPDLPGALGPGDDLPFEAPPEQDAGRKGRGLRAKPEIRLRIHLWTYQGIKGDLHDRAVLPGRQSLDQTHPGVRPEVQRGVQVARTVTCRTWLQEGESRRG